MEMTYRQNGDYLIPDIRLSEQEETPIGKYGQMRKQYLKEHPDIAEAIKDEILGKNMDTEMADDSAPAEAGTADGTLESEEMEA